MTMKHLFCGFLLCLLSLLSVPIFAQNTPEPASQTRFARPDPYTPQVPPRAIAYRRTHRALGLTALVWNLLGLWLLLRTGLAARLRAAVYRILCRPEPEPGALPPFRVFALLFVFYTLLVLAWRLPFALAGLAVEHAYGFSNQKVEELLFDQLLYTLFGLVLLPVLFGGAWLHARAPRRGWIAAWGLLIPLLVFQFILQPVLIAPAFNRFTPLPDGPLREKILALAGKAGITGARVFVEDTSRRTRHVNAYVTGIGLTTRIVLNDTAIEILPEDQLLALMGHEMGHYVEGHSWINLGAAMIGAGFFLWWVWGLLPALVRRFGPRWRLHSLYDPAALPLFLLTLSVFTVAQAPLENGLSRTMERRADAFGLRVTGLQDATARLFVGFAERDYSDPDPPALLQFWFGSHPPLRERIAFALQKQE
jgi:STE24 endopeptidase